MSNAGAVVPSRWATSAAADGRLQRVGDRGEHDAADLVGVDAGVGQRLAGRGDGHVDDRLVGRGEAAGDDAGALTDPLVGGVDALADLVVGDDAGRAVAADAEDAGVAAPTDGRDGAHAGTASGWSRIRGWPGETGSPSSTSHSTTVPPWGAVTGCSSRSVTSMPIVTPGSSVDADRQRRRSGRCPCRGRRASARSGSRRAGTALPCRATRSRAASRSAGVFSATVSTPGSARLIRPVRVPGRRHLDDAGHAELGHRLHAQVPAHRVADLGDDPLEHGRPVLTTAPSGLEISRVRGSCTLTARA